MKKISVTLYTKLAGEARENGFILCDIFVRSGVVILCFAVILLSIGLDEKQQDRFLRV